MPLLPAARLMDIDSHGKAISSASPNVITEKQPQARVGDGIAPCSSVIAKGSLSVFVNKLAAARTTDPTTCSGNVASGARKTFIGDGDGDGKNPRGCFLTASQNGSATISW